MDIGKVIKRLLHQRGETQMNLANGIGVSQKTISCIITGKSNPRPETMGMICEYFGVPLSVILFMGVERDDIRQDRRAMFDKVWPAVSNLMSDLF